jgi:hypothetical protein
MSGSFVFGVRPLPIPPLSIVGGATTIIVDATNKSITVPNFEINEVSGGSGTLTVELWDGTTHIYLGDDGGTAWNLQGVTARKSYKFSAVYVIPKGSVLRMVNASGNFTVFGTQLPTG